jgi:outer membrane lipoprotein SlyB
MTKPLSIAALFLASCFSASAQTPSSAQPPSWARLQALPSGAALHVKTTKETTNCAFKSATEEALTCSDGDKAKTYPRAEVKSVKLRHRGRSALAGLAIGAGGGAVVGASLGRSGSFLGHGEGAVIVAVPGAIIGTIVGICTDFTHSTIYSGH